MLWMKVQVDYIQIVTILIQCFVIWKKIPNCTENLLSFDFLLFEYETKVLLGLSVYKVYNYP